jgi:cytochrome c oxidase subunit II
VETPPGRLRRSAASAGALAACATILSGCGVQSPLDPKSEPARHIATLWWWMLAVAGVVFLGAVILLVASWFLRGRDGIPRLGGSPRLTTGVVVLFGMVIPIAVLVPLFVVADLVVVKDTDAPGAATTALTVEVIAHQWFWEVRYPGTTAVTANELHIPARTRVNLVAKSADVIHSFWVPQLNRKIDTIPGHPNRVLLYADEPGVYRGQCAEFCGLQHAHMGTYVFADTPARFRRWLHNMSQPRRPPTSAAEKRGERVFLANQCASCHTIRGTSANGRVGPDLTHVATRTTLAALALPNGGRYLTEWISDPQHVKPGNKMPALDLTPTERREVVSYLESLR